MTGGRGMAADLSITADSLGRCISLYDRGRFSEVIALLASDSIHHIATDISGVSSDHPASSKLALIVGSNDLE